MADPQQEPDNTAYSEPPRFAPPERRKSEISPAALAIGGALLLLFGAAAGYYFKSSGVAQAAASAAPASQARAVPIFQSRAAAPAPDASPALAPPADASADRMMPAVPTSDRMMFGNQQEEAGPTTPALKPTYLSTQVTSKSIKPPNSINLSIKNPRGVVQAIVMEVNDLQVNRIAIQAMPDQKVTLPLPDLPVFVFVYKLVGPDGAVITKNTSSFQRDGSVWISPTEIDPRKRGYSVSAVYVGPFHLKH